MTFSDKEIKQEVKKTIDLETSSIYSFHNYNLSESSLEHMFYGFYRSNPFMSSHRKVSVKQECNEETPKQLRF
jgi:hypothetical protein